MQQVDLLLTNAVVLTMDDDFRQYDPGAVAIVGDRIIAVGPDSGMKSCFQPAQTIDCGGKVVMPGLINAHTHVPMTLLRGLADDLRLDVWLMGYVMPVEREFVSPEFCKLGTQIACAEMIRSGTTTFADMYYFEDAIAEATAAAGMRGLLGESVLKFPSPDAASYEDSLNLVREFIRKWKGHPLITPCPAPHAPYTTTPEIIKGCVDLCKEFDVPLQIHLSETAFEVENIRRETGMPVIPYMKKLGLLDARVVAAHCVHVDEGEMRQMANNRVGVAHNPSSNLKLASGAAPVQKMRELKVNVGLGTDGPASNNDLDMFEEIRLASLVAKLQTGDPTALPARAALWMATRGSAKAIHMDREIGSLEVGKRADLILIDLFPIHNNPRFRRDQNNGPYSQIVYAGKSTDVTDVLINGKWVMRDRKLLTLDEAGLMKEAQEWAGRIDTFLMAREQSVLSKLVAIGGAMEEESFEIQLKVRIPETAPVLEALRKPGLEILRDRHYREFDTYFYFEEADQGRLRHREDEFVDEKGNVTQARARLTHIGQSREAQVSQQVLLSRSRYFAPANNSLRFYREYFKPKSEIEIHKDRLRYLVKFKDTEFFINIDKVTKPDLGTFLEIKSRTWSRQDAEQKSKLIHELIEFLGASAKETETRDYIEVTEKKLGFHG